MRECTCQEIGHIMKLFNQLDGSDKKVVLTFIDSLLSAEKYAVKKRITDRKNNIITVDFTKK